MGDRLSLILVAGMAAVMLQVYGVDAADKNGESFADYSSGTWKARPETTQEKACDCCMACKAATKDVKPEKENGLPATDGCRDCCERCGTENLPIDDEKIPEKMK